MHSFLLFILVILAPIYAVAQPSVVLTPQVLNAQRSVLFTFDQPDIASMNGCHYNLFAADKRSDLSTLPGKGRSIATFFKTLSQIQIIAGPLPRMKLKEGQSTRVSVYFRTLLSCPSGLNGLGEIKRITLNRIARGTVETVDQMTRKMKHNMQYYGDSIGK